MNYNTETITIDDEFIHAGNLPSGKLHVKYYDLCGSPVFENPCKTCEFKKCDKEVPLSVCDNCEKRILFDLSLVDYRLALREKGILDYDTYHLDDIDEQIKIADENTRCRFKTSEEIVYKLIIASRKNGFGDDYNSFLINSIEVERMSYSKLGRSIGVSWSTISRRYKKLKKTQL